MSKGNWIIRNIIWAVVFFAVLLGGVMIFLHFYTRHGTQIAVPDLTNMSIEQAGSVAAAQHLTVVVADSVFVRRMEKGAIFSQNPKPGERVKEGRRIKVTTNAVVAKKVSMPELGGLSMRWAKSELNSRGLVLGKLIYVRDIASNNVLKQMYRGKEIKAGTHIESGSSIDLVVGLQDEDNRTYIPDVVGMKNLRAVDVIHDNSLNIRSLNFDSSVKSYTDTLNAVVYRQGPGASSEPVLMGSEVALYLSIDPAKLPSTK